ncbi:hypothetical protein BT96DRAFT_352138 [Gymnopus androsaceus JB14]|uniref:Transmembrane protein n=1 Tax=Gymnopus androsaceus JB14 TaxID=1447944 RepID=A0A6A4GZ23_9AGAR|nr:hypothetical protein BT96DRAFT_352138 [Gymnopus androsaceus JB14]
MTFYDNTSLDIEAEGGRSQDQLADHKGRSIFAYNGNPRLFPRFRSTVTDSAGKPQTDAKGRSSFRYFFSQTLQQCYLMIFFRLPTLYQSRMLQVGSDSGIGSVDLHHMSTSFSAHWKPELMALPPAPGGKGNSVVVSAELIKFQAAWGVLVDELLQEWKTFNIVAALLQTSIPILLTLDGETGSDPITRTGALLSFVCAGISLFCGSVCLLRFGSMRKMPKAAKWIHEAQNNSQLIWWNCWIMLAMPLTWLAWSVILFFATMMSYTWQSSFQDVSLGSQTSAHTTLSFRITISSVLGFGILCVAALAITLSFVFGDSLDQKFMSQVEPFLPSHQEPRAETHPAQLTKGQSLCFVSCPFIPISRPASSCYDELCLSSWGILYYEVDGRQF